MYGISASLHLPQLLKQVKRELAGGTSFGPQPSRADESHDERESDAKPAEAKTIKATKTSDKITAVSACPHTHDHCHCAKSHTHENRDHNHNDCADKLQESEAKPSNAKTMKRPLPNKNAQQRARKRRRATKEETEQRFRDIITERGGTVIGTYKSSKYKIECRCPNGHKCYPRPSRVLNDGIGMCLTCAGQDPREADAKFQKCIKDQGGRVIGRYNGANHPVECRCKNGHKCSPTPRHIIRGDGMCLTCAGHNPEVAEAAFRKCIKEKHRGKVIGPYKGSLHPVECRCSNNHKCYPTPNSVQRGYGICRTCAGNNPKVAEAKFRKSIKEQGGTVQGKYVNGSTKVECICINQHRCSPRPHSVLQGHAMCGECANPSGEKKFGSLLRKVSKSVEHKFQLKKWKVDFKVGNCLFEFDGGAHFGPVEIHGGVEKFNNYQRPRDLASTRAALATKYRMVRVHYDWIYKSEKKQLAFLRAALASSQPLLVSHAAKYKWLDDAGIATSFLST
jgi:hypothetical protein